MNQKWKKKLTFISQRTSQYSVTFRHSISFIIKTGISVRVTISSHCWQNINTLSSFSQKIWPWDSNNFAYLYIILSYVRILCMFHVMHVYGCMLCIFVFVFMCLCYMVCMLYSSFFQTKYLVLG